MARGFAARSYLVRPQVSYKRWAVTTSQELLRAESILDCSFRSQLRLEGRAGQSVAVPGNVHRRLAADLTPAEKLYHDLCRNQNVDEGEPLEFDVMFVLEPSIEDRVTRTTAIPTLQSTGSATLDNLRQSVSFAGYVCSTRQTNSVRRGTRARFTRRVRKPECLRIPASMFRRMSFQDLAQAWRRSDQMWRERQTGSRVINALTFFSYAWHAHYLEQVCLNLAIALECLFAPHSHSETTH